MSTPRPASTDHQQHEQLNITLEPVTSLSDIAQFAHINEKALEGDALKQWMALYTGRTEWETTVEAVTGALRDPNHHVVKAVISDSEGDEKIVGFVHWMCGYICLEGGYNVAQSNCKQDVVRLEMGPEDVKDPSSDLEEKLAGESLRPEKGRGKGEDEACVRRLKRGEVKYVETRNHYIRAIRGKKHVFVRRIMVLPEFQGRGVGRRLMNVVTDDADRQGIVCWLFAGPAGERMYESSGFKVVSVTDMDEPEDGFVCPASKGMMRLPQPMV